MKYDMSPNQQNGWLIPCHTTRQCLQDMQVDVAIVGGGIAGLSTAQEFAARGKKVAVFEQYFCGAGASGKNAGFVTPNSELSLSDLQHQKHGKSQEIWTLINQGLESIRSNIIEHKMQCDYSPDGGLLLANCPRTFKNLTTEHHNVNNLGFNSKLFSESEVKNIVGSSMYYGAMSYDNSFSINTYQYLQELQRILTAQGVDIFEETPVTKIDDHTITTPYAKITAQHIVICVDRFLPQFQKYDDYIYHIQNFVLMSSPLSQEQIQSIFPTKKYMAWDSELIYNYFRITPDHRLILGGGDIFSAYSSQELYNYGRGYQKLQTYFAHAFKNVSINFQYQWPGLIGISKDVRPIATRDEKYPHLYYIAASAGLPVAASLAKYATQNILDNRHDLDNVFTPHRAYAVKLWMQKILGKRLSFAINNFISQKTVGCFK